MLVTIRKILAELWPFFDLVFFFFFFVELCTYMHLCALRNFDTLIRILIIFDRDEEEDQ